MIYSNLVKVASQICFEAHQYDVDKGGYPYVMHPFYLAFQMEDEASCCVALLHDVIEDHGDEYSFASLKQMGMTDEIIDALKLLTHDSDVPYMDYVKEIKKNEIARKVKIADLKHNLDATRVNGAITKKRNTYIEALTYLEK